MSRGTVVMVLTNDFVSDPRVEKEGLALASDGWDVTVIAWDRSQSLPASESRGPIRIERLGPAAPYGGGVRSILRFRAFWRRASARTLQLRPEVVHCHDLDTAPVGLAAIRRSRDQRPRLVLDFHELYRASRMVPQSGVTGALARPVVRALERRAIAAADAVVIANPGSVSAYDEYDARVKIVLVENAPEAELFRSRQRRGDSSEFRVCYVGQKRYADRLRDLMEAVQHDTRLSARLAGGGVAEAEVARLAAVYDRVEVSGPFTRDQAPGLYDGCDAVYAVYDAAVGNIQYATPVKALEGMAAGLPVIVNRGTWFSELVLDAGAGVAVTEGDVDQLAEVLVSLADDRDRAASMGANGRAIIDGGLNWDAAANRLIDAYRRL